jgi:hypothetical protein
MVWFIFVRFWCQLPVCPYIYMRLIYSRQSGFIASEHRLIDFLFFQRQDNEGVHHFYCVNRFLVQQWCLCCVNHFSVVSVPWFLRSKQWCLYCVNSSVLSVLWFLEQEQLLLWYVNHFSVLSVLWFSKPGRCLPLLSTVSTLISEPGQWRCIPCSVRNHYRRSNRIWSILRWTLSSSKTLGVSANRSKCCTVMYHLSINRRE